MKRKLRMYGSILIAVICLVCLLLFLLVWNGVILLNNPSSTEYPVRGVDVSSYQGEIDWKTLADQDISFAFMKATEGSSFTDPRFAYNYEQAQQTHLRIGAYHFFSYDSGGDTQAEHFISTVYQVDNMLPPVIDLEFYGEYDKNPPDRDTVRHQLDIMLDKLQAHYGMKPIIYATERSYSLYLAGAYDAYDIWIRNVIGKPKLSDQRKWTFWQYTNRARLEGYRGKEKYIDLNVFDGTRIEFENYAK